MKECWEKPHELGRNIALVDGVVVVCEWLERRAGL